MYVQPELRKILVLTTHLRFYYMTNTGHLAAAVNASLVDDPALVLRTMISANRCKKAAEIRRFGRAATAGPGALFRTISLVGLVKNDIVAQISEFWGVVLCNIVLTAGFASVCWFCSVLPTSGQTLPGQFRGTFATVREL
jgi:hypothetical protein